MNRAERRGFKGKQIDNVLTRSEAFVGVMLDRKTGTVHCFHDIEKCDGETIAGNMLLDAANRLNLLCKETNAALAMGEKELKQAILAQEVKEKRSKELEKHLEGRAV
jgi:hypothetical protein